MLGRFYPRPVAAFFLLVLSATAHCDTVALGEEAIAEIVVTADYRGRTVKEFPASVSVLDAGQVDQLAVQHFEELVNVVPNLNWSGDGHRARYFQIRGVGELEQYQGAPNPSVGFLLDDIDYSGIGSIATLFDVERIEVLRGPQGSRYGSSALAGLVYMWSAQPSVERNGRLHFSVADDDAISAGIAIGGSLRADDRALYRVSAHHHESNGYRDNAFLDRDDSNGRNESVVRGRFFLQPNESVDINVAALYSRVDDGYDAFALDNSYTVLSDKPGKDAQDSVGLSVKVEWFGLQNATLTSITSLAESDIDFDFDADWGNDDSWAPFIYDFVSVNDRERSTFSQELRLASSGERETDWLAGIYALRLEDDLLTSNRGEYFDPFSSFSDSLDESFGSNYVAGNIAMFGQIEQALGKTTRLSIGVRFERRTTDYRDSAGLLASPSEIMTGGDIALTHIHSPELSSYISVARGFKAGGFNLGLVPDDRRDFDSEALWNVEAGFKSQWLNNALKLNASVFYNKRNDQQVRTSLQLIPGDPASFVFLTDNAANGETIGLEADARWSVNNSWEVYANLGLLDATFDDYQTPRADLSGRDQPHAPNYTVALGAEYRHPSGWFARIDATAKDAFFFDVSHNQKSKAYELFNARLGYVAEAWSAQLWARNLLDKQYAVRGFFFGNEPPDFADTLYTRLGDPRQIGISIDRRF